MDIKIISGSIDESPSLTKYATEKMQETVAKYFDIAVSADVHFKKEGPFFSCVIIVNEGVKGGINIKSDHQDADIYKAFDESCEKVDKQLRRYKRKITHHKGKKPQED